MYIVRLCMSVMLAACALWRLWPVDARALVRAHMTRLRWPTEACKFEYSKYMRWGSMHERTNPSQRYTYTLCTFSRILLCS